MRGQQGIDSGDKAACVTGAIGCVGAALVLLLAALVLTPRDASTSVSQISQLDRPAAVILR